MKVERHRDYPVSAKQLMEALTSRHFFEARFSMSGIDDFHFEAFEETDRGLLIRVLRDMELKADKVPSFARRFLGRSYTLVQEFVWTERQTLPYRAEYRFGLGDIPVTVHGEIELEEHDGQARQHYRVSVESRVPVIGRKLAELVGARVEKALDSDYRGTLKYLRAEGLADA